MACLKSPAIGPAVGSSGLGGAHQTTPPRSVRWVLGGTRPLQAVLMANTRILNVGQSFKVVNGGRSGKSVHTLCIVGLLLERLVRDCHLGSTWCCCTKLDPASLNGTNRCPPLPASALVAARTSLESPHASLLAAGPQDGPGRLYLYGLQPLVDQSLRYKEESVFRLGTTEKKSKRGGGGR
ncbi:hypothetical protein B0T26DRAFT_768412 [Lasiosphaeria miniovina]|uniref:Uncharacterized protein n=1 Tax=Lasiosphaeria miniovina TaxID=1954250 RepID=A0AA40B6S2_9PEZI|nr:uncharacterized protein B0T26DRAFT_768412 [Lasiosphaeria miniovina]KAK0728712.1 hypothetical protein B0T26DRAFT_768412 [Lasiosphaeria miniovina]